MVAELRSHALSLSLADLHLRALPDGRSILAVLMETGVEDDRAWSLVAIADGTVSLYFSNGGGYIGAGERERVRTAAAEFLDLAEHFVPSAAYGTDTPLPTDGIVTLGEDRDPLTPLFYSGHAVVAEIRGLDEPPGSGSA